MHPLRNGSQATARPAAKPLTGTPGWFTESGDNNVPSYPGADWFNHVIAEFLNALAEVGITFDPENEVNLAQAFSLLKNQIDDAVSGLASTQYVDDKVASVTSLVVEASNQIEEDVAFASGALAVIRLDLIAPRASLFMNFENPSVFQDLSGFLHPIIEVGTPSITNSVSAPNGIYVADLRGANNFLYLNDAPSLRLTGGISSGWGMEAYLRIDSAGSGDNKFLFSKGVQSNLNNHWYLGLIWNDVSSDYNVIFVGANNTPMFTIPYPHSADLVNFHHISVNSNGSTVSLYIDGVFVGSAPELDIYDGGGLLYIGSWIYTVANTDCGYVDQVVISNDGPLRNGNFTPPTGA